MLLHVVIHQRTAVRFVECFSLQKVDNFLIASDIRERLPGVHSIGPVFPFDEHVEVSRVVHFKPTDTLDFVL